MNEAALGAINGSPRHALPVLERVPLRSWFALGTLLLLSIYAVMDRQVFILLAEPIRRDLVLSDQQLGLLQGVGLALIGVLTTYPISYLADRFDRRWVMAGCMTLWSLAVFGCAMAPNFTWLFAFSAFVGIGELGVGPASLAVIPDLFPESRRQLANSVFAIVSRLGSAIAVYLTGVVVTVATQVRPALPASLANLSDWRLGFIGAVIFLPIALFLLLTLPAEAAGTREPAVKLTGRTKPAAPGGDGVFIFLRRHRDAQLRFLGASLLMTFGLTAVAAWVPVIAQRYYGQTPIESGQWLASMALLTGVAGFLIGTPLLRWLEPRFGRALPMRVMTYMIALSTVFAAMLAFAGSATMLYLLWGAQAVCLMIASMVQPTIIQNMTPIHLRARLFAIMTLVLMVGGALSPVVVGSLSDRLGNVPHPLQWAALSIATVSLIGSSLIYWSATASYARLADIVLGDEKREHGAELAA